MSLLGLGRTRRAQDKAPSQVSCPTPTTPTITRLTPLFRGPNPATTWTLSASVVDPPEKVYSTISARYLNELYTSQTAIRASFLLPFFPSSLLPPSSFLLVARPSLLGPPGGVGYLLYSGSFPSSLWRDGWEFSLPPLGALDERTARLCSGCRGVGVLGRGRCPPAGFHRRVP